MRAGLTTRCLTFRDTYAIFFLADDNRARIGIIPAALLPVRDCYGWPTERAITRNYSRR